MKDFDTFKKLPKNVGDLGKIIVATGFEKFPKGHKSPNLVTLYCQHMCLVTSTPSRVYKVNSQLMFIFIK